MGVGKRRAQVFYLGRVQGVGFRFTVREIANRFTVTGYVKNLPDGRVELVAEGEEDEVKEFLRTIGQSELSPMIQNETIDWSEATGKFDRFAMVM